MTAIPKWARKHIKAEGATRVSVAVARAEALCVAEFVPVLARSSASYAHAPWMLGLACWVLILSWQALAGIESLGQAWPWIFADAALAALGGTLLARWSFLRRLCVPGAARYAAVRQAALLAFHEHDLQKTSGGTGILIYVSLDERQAVVLADASVANKVAVEVWDGVIEKVLAGARAGDLASGFEAGLDQAASIVRAHFPRRKKLKNQLRDRLVIVA